MLTNIMMELKLHLQVLIFFFCKDLLRHCSASKFAEDPEFTINEKFDLIF